MRLKLVNAMPRDGASHFVVQRHFDGDAATDRLRSAIRRTLS